jgi:hypothetical protein
MVSGIAEVEASINGWRKRLSDGSRNFVDLVALPQFEALRGRLRQILDSTNGVCNKTTNEIAKVITTSDEIERGLQLVADAITTAEGAKIRASKLFGGESALIEAISALTTDCIVVPLDNVPILRRTLGSSNLHSIKVSLPKLWSAMEDAFSTLQSLLKKIEEVDLKVDQAIKNSRILIQKANLSEGNHTRLSSALEQAASLIETDSFAALEIIENQVVSVLLSLEEAEKQKQKDKELSICDLMNAKRELNQLDLLERKMMETLDILKCSITDVTVPSPDISRAHELPTWLDRIASNLEDERLQAFKAGMLRWRMLLVSVVQEMEDVRSKAKTLLNRREDLRRNFSILLKNYNNTNPHEKTSNIDNLQMTLKSCLFEEATSLRNAETLIKEFKEELSHLSSK